MTAVGDIVELSYGKALKECDRDGGEVPVVGSGGILGGHSMGITDGPTIIVGRKGSIGSVTWIDGTAWPIDTAYFVKPRRDDLDRRWAYWMLRSLHMETMNKSAAIPGLDRDDVYRIHVEVPTPLEQRRIAAILDRADSLRAKRRQVVTHLDSVTQSMLHEMLRAPHERCQLGEVATFFGGSSLPVGTAFEGQVGGTLLMKVSDMNLPGNEVIVKQTVGWTSEQTGRSSTVDAGAVVLPKRGASIATNKKRLATRQTALDPNLMGIQGDPNKLLPLYLLAWFQAFDLVSITSGSSVPQLNKQDLTPLILAVPRVEQQRAFEVRAAGIAACRVAAVAALAADDELFASLQSRAFRGEL